MNTQLSGQRTIAVAVAVYAVAILTIFYPTTASMVSIWQRSDTFAHGFLIAPISLWLVWGMRDQLATIPARPLFLPLLGVVVVGFVWLLATLVDVLVVQQLCLVTMLILGIWALVGNQLASKLAFPLGFLLFAVPMGEGLVPPMMDFTATSTVWLIRLTGIPVYREGLFFMLPSGNWSVVEACSGVRYLIASITLGTLYAYLSYQSLARRLAFIALAIIVPIIANTLRAYMIVMLGHLSDMTIATGVDHLVYGWLFFGVVMFILFWLGAKFSDLPAERSAEESVSVTDITSSARPIYSVLIGAVIVAASWPLLASTVFDQQPGAPTSVALAPPWIEQNTNTIDWQPYRGKLTESREQFDRGEGQVVLLLQFPTQRDIDLVGHAHRFVQADSNWNQAGVSPVELTVADKPVRAVAATLHSGARQVLAWSWYKLGEHHTSNNYIAKLYQLLSEFGSRSNYNARVIVATEIDEKGTLAAAARLRSFVKDINFEGNTAAAP
jgi:exosortase A